MALSRLFGLAAKVETTPGVDATPTFSANAIRLAGLPTVEDIFVAENKRDGFATGSLGAYAPELPAGAGYRVKFRVPLVGSGLAYSATVLPPIHPLMLAAGFQAAITTTVGSETVAYTFADNPASTVTVILEMGSQKWKMLGGVVESFDVTCDAGGFPVVDFSIVGTATAPSDQVLEVPTYSNVAYPIWKGTGSLALATVTGLGAVRSVAIHSGLKATMRQDANAADAFPGVQIVDRRPTLDVTTEVTALSNYNPRADFVARTQRQVTVAFGQSGAQYTKVSFVAPNGVVDNNDHAPKDDNGLMVWSASYLAARVGTPSELSITFS